MSFVFHHISGMILSCISGKSPFAVFPPKQFLISAGIVELIPAVLSTVHHLPSETPPGGVMRT